MMTDIVEKYQLTVSQEFRKSVGKDTQLRNLVAKIKAGKGTQKDVAKVADKFGVHLEQTLKKVLVLDNLPDQKLTNDFANAVVRPALTNTMDKVNGQAIMQMRFTDKAAGRNIGIKAGDSVKRIDDTIGKMVAAENQEKLNVVISEDVKSDPRKFYDDFQKTNAEIRQELGYDQVVIRTYDDVGLDKPKRPCQWCIDRAGTWDYKEARENGVFNRHPGCGCTIELITSDNTRQTQTNWRHNEWE